MSDRDYIDTLEARVAALEAELTRLRAEKEDIAAAIGFDYEDMRAENARLREAALIAPRDFDEVVLYLDQARRGVLTDAYAVEELLLRLGEHEATPDQETPREGNRR